MALKDLLFISSDESKKENKKFPDSGREFPVTVQSDTPAPSCDPYIEEVVGIYEKGFNALNMSGYDFYEFYKSVMSSGDESPLVYKMAFNMGKSMDNSLSKDKILTQSDYYLNEIEKVFSQYEKDGNKKMSDLLESKSNDKVQLDRDISSIESQISDLKSKLETKKSERNGIEIRWSSEISTMECKILANKTAKNNLTSSITKVISGIKSNL